MTHTGEQMVLDLILQAGANKSPHRSGPEVKRSRSQLQDEILLSVILRKADRWLSNRFSVIFFRACREELLHLCFPAGQVQVLPAG